MGAAEAFQQALRAKNDDARWDQVTWLREHGGEDALAIAGRLSTDPDPMRRSVATDVLGGLAAHREAALGILLSVVDAEDDPDVLCSIATGLGHIGDERGAGALARLSAHPDPDVRSAALAGYERPVE